MRTTNTIMETLPEHAMEVLTSLNINNMLLTNIMGTNIQHTGVLFNDLFSERIYKAPENDNYINKN